MQQGPAPKKKKVKVPRVVNGIETMVEIADKRSARQARLPSK